MHLLLDIKTPTLGFNIANVLELIVEADPKKVSVIVNDTFFLFKLFNFLILTILINFERF